MTRQTFNRVMQFRKGNELWLKANYLEDKDDRISLHQAVRLIRQAISMGVREAQGSLAHAYDTGRGVRYSRRMALHHWRKAWRAGSSSAANNIGITLRIEGREASSIKWFRRAIAGGDPDARFHLARIFLQYTNRRREALSLLEAHVAAGPQTIYEYGENALPEPIPDDDFEEAKKLLQELSDTASV